MNTSHPGEIIRRRYLEPLDLTLSTLAEALDVSVSSVSRVVNEKADLSCDMAMRLSHVLGGAAQMWMNLQTNYSISKAKPLELTKLKKLNQAVGRYDLDDDDDDDDDDDEAA